MPLIAFFVAVLVLAACSSSPTLGHAPGPLELDASELEFGRIYAGGSTIRGLRVRNTGSLDQVVRVRASGPFTAPAAVALRAGELVVIDARFVPGGVGRAEGELELRASGQLLRVRLLGTAVARPACEPAGPCAERVFDPAAGACVSLPRPDGTDCSGAVACLSGAVCRAGACVGLPEACDDGDACTQDACDRDLGCVHRPATCPAPSDPCRAAACDAALGCLPVDAPDGTPCGASDCSTARVCVAGRCERRAVPEGAVCAPATPCQGPGTCHGGGCMRPAPTPLAPAWTIDAPAGTAIRFAGLTDAEGSVDWLECTGDACALASATSGGVLRFRAPLDLGADAAAPGAGALLSGGLVVLTGAGRVEARRQSDGARAWLAELAPGGTSTEPVALPGGEVAVATTSPGAAASTLHRLRLVGGADQPEPLPLVAESLIGSGAGLTVYGHDAQQPLRADLAPGAPPRVQPFPEARPLGAYAGWQLVAAGNQVAFAWPDGALASPDGAATWSGGYALQALSPLAAPGAGFLLGVRGGDDRPLVLGFDPDSAAVRWAVALDALPAGTRLGQPLLAEGGVALVTTRGPDGRRALHAFEADGAGAFHCPLPESAGSGAALRGGRWIEAESTPAGARLAAYDLPGYEASASGWAAERGGPGRPGTP